MSPLFDFTMGPWGKVVTGIVAGSALGAGVGLALAESPRLRYAVIWFLDWIVDVRILRHRFPRYCAWLADHPWWGR